MNSMDPDLVEHFVRHFDHHDARLGADPFAVSTAMRERCPVAHSDVHGGFWIVSGYEDVRTIMQNPAVFTSAKGARIPSGGGHRPLPPLEVDPPDHAKYRGLISRAFSPRNIAALEPKIRELCDMLIGKFQDKGHCDLKADLAAPLPTTIFTEMMGLPAEDFEKFHAWATLINHQAHEGEGAVSAGEATRQTLEYLQTLLGERRAKPQDDLATALLDAMIDDEPISADGMVGRHTVRRSRRAVPAGQGRPGRSSGPRP
ncbi:cytochrome P450 [Frankia sp. CNm7]|uniref:Cytochrome P450 n=1 Tax=Frankia nepalensis TaxID=1836974 RepID=A0A937UJV6_9ACTN|nr:cytochrome P450 [Frankia nepalensis]MBL7496894.1 cytochrome P450 [Frankia nepalensis]MBL7508345.1 cytochrome P450 [Frankia nepalensis]MBL7524551.1 cytochrome P450 [Frankia nepalensis]MBL7626174.1 cytochrome P450 [Frankia nepalensis]